MGVLTAALTGALNNANVDAIKSTATVTKWRGGAVGLQRQ